MLEPVTKDWEDLSTLEEFAFKFFCDCCHKELTVPKLKFNDGFRRKRRLTPTEEKLRGLVWARDHEAAYERANLFMHQNHVHYCEICGDHICGDCAYVCDELEGGVCCEKCLKEKGYHGIRMWEGE